jgi:hypothetical protein
MVTDSGKALTSTIELPGLAGVRVFLLCAEPSGVFGGMQYPIWDAPTESNLVHDTGGEQFIIPYKRGKTVFDANVLDAGMAGALLLPFVDALCPGMSAMVPIDENVEAAEVKAGKWLSKIT